MRVRALLPLTLTLFWPPIVWADTFGFFIPSFVAIRGGLSDYDSNFIGVSAGLTLEDNWIAGASLENSSVLSVVDQENLTTTNLTLSLSTDPLQDWSFQAALDGWKSENAVSAYGGRFSTTWMGRRWIWSLEVGLQQIAFGELPALLWEGGSSTVGETSTGLRGEFFLSRRFSLRAAHRIHWYDQHMEDYAEGFRVRFIPSEVLNLAGTLTKEDTEMAVTYARKRWHFTLETLTMVSSLDELRSYGLSLRSGYRISRRWALELQGARYESESVEDATTDHPAPLHSFSTAMTYSW